MFQTHLSYVGRQAGGGNLSKSACCFFFITSISELSCTIQGEACVFLHSHMEVRTKLQTPRHLRLWPRPARSTGRTITSVQCSVPPVPDLCAAWRERPAPAPQTPSQPFRGRSLGPHTPFAKVDVWERRDGSSAAEPSLLFSPDRSRRSAAARGRR